MNSAINKSKSVNTKQHTRMVTHGVIRFVVYATSLAWKFLLHFVLFWSINYYDVFYDKFKILMFWKRSAFLECKNNNKNLEGAWNVTFVGMMLVKLINVSLARVICIWFVAINPEGDDR